MESPDPRNSHRVIFKQMTERIELAYETAVKQGLQNPMVLVLDLHDENARKIADTSGRNQRTDEVVAEAERRGVVPLGIWHLPSDVAARWLADFPDVVAQLHEIPPPSTFYTVMLAAGAVSLVLTPCP
jgi:hypothetical protein